MDLLNTYIYSNELFELVAGYASKYQQKLLLVLLIIALLNCFFGYHLRKVWGILAGMLIGAILSAIACIYINKTGTILYIAVTLAAFTLGLLALLLYRVGLFFIGALTVPLILSRLFPAQSMDTLVIWLIAGLVVATLTLVWERESVSIITAIGGGFGTAKCLVLMKNHPSFMVLLLLGIALTLSGLLLQFQPWRSRSAWNSDEARARDKHRHKRRMKRIRKKKKYQEKPKQKTADQNREPDTVQKRRTTEYIPYSTRPLRQTTSNLNQGFAPDGYPEQDPYRQTDRYPSQDPYRQTDRYPSQDPYRQTDRYPAPEQQMYPKEHTPDPNLSDIRQLISREVADIYQEQQKEMDQVLDQLLETEYEHTTRNLNKKR